MDKIYDKKIDEVFIEIDYILKSVNERGIVENELENDDFLILRRQKEFKELIISELYESYFLPERHEFDWHLLELIVNFLCDSKTIDFLLLSGPSGIIGNALYDLLKKILKKLITQMKEKHFKKERYNPFEEMILDIDQIQLYFTSNKTGKVYDIYMKTKISIDRIPPLLKILGFNHNKRKNKCVWYRNDGNKKK